MTSQYFFDIGIFFTCGNTFGRILYSTQVSFLLKLNVN